MRSLPLALLAAAPALAQAPAPSPIRAAAIGADVRALSDDRMEGRGPGTRGEERTLAYLREQFAAAGLKPGGADGGWFQDVPLTRVDVTERRLALTANGRPLPLTEGRDWAMNLNREGAVDLRRVALVFGGFGITAPDRGWDDYSGVDLTGKAVLLLANDPDYDQPSGPFGGPQRDPAARTKVADALRRGAVAVVQIHQDAASRRPWTVNTYYLAEPRYRLGDAAPPPTVQANLSLSEGATRRLFAAAGLDFAVAEAAAKRAGFRAMPLPGATLSLGARATARPYLTHNILARIDGTTRSAETVIVGAHWDAYGLGAPDARGDTIRNGAVDNAMGTAEMLEVARSMARGPAHKRSVLFIGYTSEEDGLLGAYHYAAHPVRPLATTAAVFNLDPHLALPRTRTMELIGAGRSGLEDDFARAVAAEGLTVEPEQLPDENWYQRSDHLAFAEAGVPTVYFRAGRDLVAGGRARGSAWVSAYDPARYHQRSDEFDPAWDFAAAAQEATIAYRLTAQVANGDGWPEWRSGSAAAAYARTRAATAGQRR